MMGNRCVITILLSAIFLPIIAQNRSIFEQYKRQKQQQLSDYSEKKQKEFDEYRRQKNREFAEYMRQRWPEYDPTPAEPIPDFPEPPMPVIKEPDTEPSNDPIPYDDVRPLPEPMPSPQPLTPLPDPITPPQTSFSFVFYGQKCDIPLENRHRFMLSGISEEAVADGWMLLSADDYLPIVAKCLDYRNSLHLCDWGYVRFVEQLTLRFFTSAQQNEARLMQMYILTQSGYKVRIARTADKLVVLLPSKEQIYEYPYLKMDGGNYYITDTLIADGPLNVYEHEFPEEQYFSLQIAEQPLFPVVASASRHLQSSHDATISAKITVNKNLIDFYNSYPLSSHWELYSRASLSQHVKLQLYPVLKNAIAGKTEVVAANMLIHFVQTAFEYQTDDKQFGRERALFSDETLYYPYSDCEDRAILFSVLVRELLGLDVVLLHYPGHLATAVCFTEDVAGDYLKIDNKSYIVCDPTYINADIGMTMPQYKQTAASVIRIGE